MGKKSRRNSRRNRATARPDLYVPPLNPRPFAGLANELELAAMRELLPAATLTLTTTPEYGEREVTFATIVAGTGQAMVRSDGRLLVAMQTRSRTADASHDLGVVVKEMLDVTEQTTTSTINLRQHGPSLQDLFGDTRGTCTIEPDLGFWLAEGDRDEDAQEAIRRTGEEIVPCECVPGQRATYLTTMTHDFVRMVLPDDEDAVVNGLARLRASGELDISDGSLDARFIGAFRMLGLVTPVWEFSRRVNADEIAEAVAALRSRIDEAIARDGALSARERQVREGILSRQVSIR
nr:DUF5926 family protein [Nanchangia anserum]